MIPFRIGADASCTDGACGQVSRIIVNPVTRQVTHLAVDPKQRPGPGRLVPVDLVDATTGQIRLGRTLAEFHTLPPAQEAQSVRDLDPTGHDSAGVRAAAQTPPAYLGGLRRTAVKLQPKLQAWEFVIMLLQAGDASPRSSNRPRICLSIPRIRRGTAL